MIRVRTVLSGFTGGPGLNTAYFTAGIEDTAAVTTCVARVHAAWTAARALFASTMSIQVSGEADILDPVTGDVTGSLQVTSPAVIVGNAIGTALAPPQAAVLVNFRTGVFVEGRRIRGRHFLSPVADATVESDGTPTTAAITLALSYASTLIGTVDLEPVTAVWQRPRKADALAVPPVTARPGRTANVISGSVPNKFATLRSRRD